MLLFNLLDLFLPKQKRHTCIQTGWIFFQFAEGQHHSPTVLRFGDGIGAALAVILGHIFTLLEGGSLILQNVSDTEGVAVKSPLLTQFGAVWAQGLIVNLREVYVFAFIHHVTLFLVNISWKNQK